jgi:hypothetical protein
VTENEKLRKLLVEARDLYGCHGQCPSACVWSRIDAALAEPSEQEETEHAMHMRVRAGYDKTIADAWRAKVAEVERERDALRAQNEHMASALEDAIKIQKEAVANAYRRGAEAMREAAGYVKHSSHEDGLGLGSLRMESGIRALPIPKENP